jgi:uncharacterized protein DUF6916
MLRLDTVTREDFALCLDQDFELITATGGITLRLVEAENRGAGREGHRVPFSLTFHGATGLRLPQGIYRLQNATLGEMEIFLVQIGDDTQGSYFEAAFN